MYKMARICCRFKTGWNLLLTRTYFRFFQKFLRLSLSWDTWLIFFSTMHCLIFDREQIQTQITSGFLGGCRLNRFNTGPVGPHLIGSFETCCNATGLSHATSWFMQNRGGLNVLLHPLTRKEILDHTIRAMWLGSSIPLDTSVLSEDLGDEPECHHINDPSSDPSTSSSPAEISSSITTGVPNGGRRSR